MVFKIKDPRWPNHNWHAHSEGIKMLLGIDPKRKLPSEGMPPRDIQGIKVWVDPLGPKNTRRRNSMRVKCECPNCKMIMAVGRLHQHVCKEK